MACMCNMSLGNIKCLRLMVQALKIIENMYVPQKQLLDPNLLQEQKYISRTMHFGFSNHTVCTTSTTYYVVEANVCLIIVNVTLKIVNRNLESRKLGPKQNLLMWKKQTKTGSQDSNAYRV